MRTAAMRAMYSHLGDLHDKYLSAMPSHCTGVVVGMGVVVEDVVGAAVVLVLVVVMVGAGVEVVVLRGAGVVLLTCGAGVVVLLVVVILVVELVGAGVLLVVITGVDVVAGDVVEEVVSVNFLARARAWCKRSKPSE